LSNQKPLLNKALSGVFRLSTRNGTWSKLDPQ